MRTAVYIIYISAKFDKLVYIPARKTDTLDWNPVRALLVPWYGRNCRHEELINSCILYVWTEPKENII
jgi:hypothetical protein